LAVLNVPNEVVVPHVAVPPVSLPDWVAFEAAAVSEGAIPDVLLGEAPAEGAPRSAPL
jgi:hypothetical protein